MPNRPASSRSAFTLIEVILAIGLSTVLLVLLTGAMGLYLFRLEASRASVEHAQLARGVLRMVAGDLRSAAVVYEQDISAAQQLAASQASFDVDQIDQAAEELTASQSSDTRRMVGLTGDSLSVQLDVAKSRPVDPAIEFGSGEAQSSPSVLRGVTTVRYFINESGLARQETSRDIELWESDQGVATTLEGSTRVIAPEVTAMRLAYSDGEQTLDAWDTEAEEGALPVAIEVELTFRQATGREDNAEAAPLRTYRMVVAMPAANSTESADAEAAGLR